MLVDVFTYFLPAPTHVFELPISAGVSALAFARIYAVQYKDIPVSIKSVYCVAGLPTPTEAVYVTPASVTSTPVPAPGVGSLPVPEPVPAPPVPVPELASPSPAPLCPWW